MAFGSEEYLTHLVPNSVGQLLQLPCITGSLCLVCTRSPCSATACPLNVLLLRRSTRGGCMGCRSNAGWWVGWNMYSWRVYGNGMQQSLDYAWFNSKLKSFHEFSSVDANKRTSWSGNGSLQTECCGCDSCAALRFVLILKYSWHNWFEVCWRILFVNTKSDEVHNLSATGA